MHKKTEVAQADDMDNHYLNYIKLARKESSSGFSEDVESREESDDRATMETEKMADRSDFEERPTDKFSIYKANKIRRYENFNQKADKSLSLAYFDWEGAAYGIYHKFNPNTADAINIQSEYAFQMTRATYGRMEADTTELRSAIFNYVLHVHGVLNDCFDT